MNIELTVAADGNTSKEGIMSARTKSISKAKDATLTRIAGERRHSQQDEAKAELKRREEALANSEFSSDPQVAANAISKKTETKKTPAARTDQKVIDRAVQLREEDGLGLVKLTAKLTEEGFKSATGKELRPQTVRQLLMRAMNTDHLSRVVGGSDEHDAPEKSGAPIIEALKENVEAAKETKRRARVAKEIGVVVTQ